jgi:hypothetical protein
MGRGPCNFRESDLKRALRAIEAAGQKAASVVIEDGHIEIKLKNGKAADDSNHTDDKNDDNTNPWDEVDLK